MIFVMGRFYGSLLLPSQTNLVSLYIKETCCSNIYTFYLFVVLGW